MPSQNRPARPVIDPAYIEESGRWDNTHKRRRMQDGVWSDIARNAVRAMAGAESASNWPPADISKNLFSSVINQIAVLHDAEGTVGHSAPGAANRIKALLPLLWPVLGENQRYTLGLRQSFLRVDVVPKEGRPSLIQRVVTPDMLLVDPDPNDPRRPLRIFEYRPRSVLGVDMWTRDILDIRDPENPSFTVDTGGNGKEPRDVTPEVLGGVFSGDTYPYRKANGTPIIPGVLYHAKPGKWGAWDAWWGTELVEAALRAVGYWTFWGHLLQDASWPQAYGLDVQLAGGSATDAKNSRAIVDVDVGSVMLFRSSGDKAGKLGNLASGSNPRELGEAIRAYAADAVAGYGINPADAQRVSVDPRSGYAISLSRGTVREQQNKQIPLFQPQDQAVLAVSAIVWNRLGDDAAPLPEEGYEVGYQGLPLSPEELKAQAEEGERDGRLGITSKVDLYMQKRGVTREEAVLALDRIALDNAKYGKPGETPEKGPENPKKAENAPKTPAKPPRS